MSFHHCILPAFIAAGVVLLPFAVQPTPADAPPKSVTQEHIDANLNIWNERLRCDRFYTVETRTKCYVSAAKHSQYDLAKRQDR